MQPITLFLCGDVMTGRGIDQILPRPSDPALHESFVQDALGYVALAESKHGAIPRRVAPEYIWGDALAELERAKPGARIVNLETSVTASDDWLDKGINYRMHPANVPCLTAAGLDCCVLANNHVLDWGPGGARGDARHAAGRRPPHRGRGAKPRRGERARGDSGCIWRPGARGRVRDAVERGAAAIGPRPTMRPASRCSRTCRTATRTGSRTNVRAVKRPGDVVVASIHWGGNWGYAIGRAERRFAHRLIEEAGVDIIHGHSSHHPKAIEVHAGKLVFYGCGDFVNDYEGISGYESYRSDLSLMYFPTLDAATGALARLELVPTQMRRFRVQRASAEDAQWLAELLEREGRPFGTRARLRDDGRIELAWGG